MRVSRRAALLTLLAGVVLLAYFKVNDADVFWQLKVGERILATGVTTDQKNAFSSIFPDHPFYNPEWLFQALLATVHGHGGWLAVAAFKLALVTLLAALLFRRLLAVREAPGLAAALTLVALAAMRSRLTERPQLASLILFSLMFLLLESARRGNRRLLWFLPPLFVLWANVHAELLLGILVLLGAAVGEHLQGRSGGERQALSPAHLVAVACLCLAAAVLNPGGVGVLTHPFLHFTLGEIVRIAEFSYSSPRDVPLFWLLLAAFLAAVARRRRAIPWATVIPAAGLAILAIRYRREIPYFALAALPLLQEAAPKPGGVRGRRAAAAGAAAVTAGALLWALRFDSILTYRWGYGVDTATFPAAAADFIEREKLPPRLYNHYDVGGYLLYRLAPPYGVFQDSRTNAYPDEFLSALHSQHGGELSRGMLERYGVNTALVWSFEAQYLLPRQMWAVVYWDDRYCVLVRRAPEHASLLARLEYAHYLPWGDASDYGDVRALEALAGEIRRNQRERSSPNAGTAAELGMVLGRLQRYEEAAAELARAVSLNPRDGRAWAYLGLAQAQRGEQDRARESWRRALELDPTQEVARRGLERASGEAPGR